jgi:hypothetical protein
MTGYAKYAGNRYNSGGQGGVSTVFNFFANDEEDSFSLVDNAPAPRQRYGARRFQNRNFQRRNWNNNIIEGGDMGKGAERERARQQRMQSKKQQQWNTWAHNRNRETITYSGIRRHPTRLGRRRANQPLTAHQAPGFTNAAARRARALRVPRALRQDVRSRHPQARPRSSEEQEELDEPVHFRRSGHGGLDG